ncbi:MAG TPA: hypothetical protein DEA05_12595 [Rhodobacteraceae bacterium]|nr:hypothetical protein [Paracoccaceae bacterium]
MHGSPAKDEASGAACPDFEHSILVNEYGFYCLPKKFGKRQIARVLKHGGVYEPATLAFLRRQAGGGDVVSGGAFIGDFFPALCEAMDSDAILHSFEPNPVGFLAAQATIALNGLRAVALHPVAVGEKTERQVLQVVDQDGASLAASGKIVPGMPRTDTRGIEVDVVTLDSLVSANRPVSILHLDVEGFEAQALRGAPHLLNERQPLVLLEAAKPRKRKQCLRVLSETAPDADYRPCGMIENNAVFRAFGRS